MKTPIQQLIEIIDKRLFILEQVIKDDNEPKLDVMRMTERVDELYIVRNSLQHQLPIEREAIEQAYIYGYNTGCFDSFTQPLEIQSLPASEKYYNDNYND